MIDLKPYSELHKEFSGTEYGQRLSKDVRYEKYNLADITHGEWIELLGRDVNNLEHMSLTHGIAVAFIRYSEQHQPDLMNDEEKRLILLVAITHDWGEAINGDISYSDKTADQEAQEQEDFDAVAVSREYGAFSYEEIKVAQAVAFDHKVGDLGRIFFAIEQLGYVRTAVKAADTVVSQDLPAKVAEGLTWLVADVFSNQVCKDGILKSSLEYDAVRAAIVSNISSIDAAFEYVLRHSEVFENYGGNERFKFGVFNKSYREWLEYKAAL